MATKDRTWTWTDIAERALMDLPPSASPLPPLTDRRWGPLSFLNQAKANGRVGYSAGGQ